MPAAPGRLDAHHADLGVPLPQQRGDARQQPAATDRHDDHVRRPPELVEDLEADRALAGRSARVVERRDHRRAGARGVVGRGGRRVVVGVAVDDHVDGLAAQRRDPVPLLARRSSAARARARGRPGCGRRRPRPGRGCRRWRRRPRPGFARSTELGDQVVGAAELVRPADLQVLPLEPDLRADGLGQPRVRLQRGGAGDAGRRAAAAAHSSAKDVAAWDVPGVDAGEHASILPVLFPRTEGTPSAVQQLRPLVGWARGPRGLLLMNGSAALDHDVETCRGSDPRTTTLWILAALNVVPQHPQTVPVVLRRR